ncbi:Chromodomain-helicase-DNA-binding protein 1-like [Gonapodya sp. JEL0774]|nr:Chromodomain-helicase-DNA-binding protein 1-like [Gonapodya sp. JEL0774]
MDWMDEDSPPDASDGGESDFEDAEDSQALMHQSTPATHDHSLDSLPETRDEFLVKLTTAAGKIPPKPPKNVTIYDSFKPPPHLNSSVTLRPYQLHGVHIMAHLYDKGLNAIIADEMGLGKTLQAITFMLHLKYISKLPPPYLVIVPLTILDNWLDEVARFTDAGSLRIVAYRGDPEERVKLRSRILSDLTETNLHFDILISTPQYVSSRDLVERELFIRIPFSFLLVDEAHSIKNPTSQLHSTLYSLRSGMLQRKGWRTLLLTGTPIQNSLAELHALLRFCNPEYLPQDPAEFESWFKGTTKEETQKLRAKLGRAVGCVVVRREKSDVLGGSMPKLTETVLFVPLTPLQLNLYRSVLARNMSIFNPAASRTSLANTLTHLLKATAHPYLFPAVEPEPFAQGEHLVDVSSKVHAADRILRWVREKRSGSKVLVSNRKKRGAGQSQQNLPSTADSQLSKYYNKLFSQSTRLLDIAQDVCHLRNLPYERLDGSVRGEERWTTVGRFQGSKQGSSGDIKGKGKRKGDDEEEHEEEEPFVFLLSTKAGGVGLNLTAADTVILLDSSPNPTHDLQAIARAHRIGQTRPVRVIRLVARDTVDEVVWRRGRHKLDVGRGVMGWAGSDGWAGDDMVKILKFGLNRIVAEGDAVEAGGKDVSDFKGNVQLTDEAFENMLEALFEDKQVTAEMLGGRASVETIGHGDDYRSGSGGSGDTEINGSETSLKEDDAEETIYMFEGKDYKTREAAAEAALVKLRKIALQESFEAEAQKLAEVSAPRATRSMGGLSRELQLVTRMQEEDHREEREAAKRRQKAERLVKKWSDAGYVSYKVGVDPDGEGAKLKGGWFWLDFFGDKESPEKQALRLTVKIADESAMMDHDDIEPEAELHLRTGSVTEPKVQTEEIGIIVHVVDNSGQWAKGRGVFHAMDKLDERIGEVGAPS